MSFAFWTLKEEVMSMTEIHAQWVNSWANSELIWIIGWGNLRVNPWVNPWVNLESIEELIHELSELTVG